MIKIRVFLVNTQQKLPIFEKLRIHTKNNPNWFDFDHRCDTLNNFN